MTSVPFLDKLPEQKIEKTVQHQLTAADVAKSMGSYADPNYPNPEVFVAAPISKSLERYVKPNPVQKIDDAALDFGWVWKYEEYKGMPGIPIRDQVIKVAKIKKQLILVRVRRYKKYVFLIGPDYAEKIAEQLKSYTKIYGSNFLVIPIAKFKKVLYS